MNSITIKNNNEKILSYIEDKVNNEYGGTVERIDGGLAIQISEEKTEELMSAYKLAKVNYAGVQVVNWGAKKVGILANATKSIGIGAVKLGAKGLFGGLKKTTELAMGAVSAIADEAQTSYAELKASEDLRSLKNSFGSTGGVNNGSDFVVVNNGPQEPTVPPANANQENTEG